MVSKQGWVAKTSKEWLQSRAKNFDTAGTKFDEKEIPQFTVQISIYIEQTLLSFLPSLIVLR